MGRPPLYLPLAKGEKGRKNALKNRGKKDKLQAGMTKIFNQMRLAVTRRTLRNQPTQAEENLWKFLRSQNLGVKFRRQYSIGRYVVDFYAPSIKLAIEVDGEIHETKKAKEYDFVRQQEIEGVGVKVLRFTNEEVLGNIEAILVSLREMIPKLPVLPLSKGEIKRGSPQRGSFPQ